MTKKISSSIIIWEYLRKNHPNNFTSRDIIRSMASANLIVSSGAVTAFMTRAVRHDCIRIVARKGNENRYNIKDIMALRKHLHKEPSKGGVAGRTLGTLNRNPAPITEITQDIRDKNPDLFNGLHAPSNFKPMYRVKPREPITFPKVEPKQETLPDILRHLGSDIQEAMDQAVAIFNKNVVTLVDKAAQRISELDMGLSTFSNEELISELNKRLKK